MIEVYFASTFYFVYEYYTPVNMHSLFRHKYGGEISSANDTREPHAILMLVKITCIQKKTFDIEWRNKNAACFVKHIKSEL